MVGSSEYCIWLCAIYTPSPDIRPLHKPLGLSEHVINPLMPLPSMISTLILTIDYYYDSVYPLPVLHFVTIIVSYSAHPGVFVNMQC